MKVAATRNGPAFAPITLTLTLESLEEAAAVHATFNFHPLCVVIQKHIDVAAIRKLLAATLPDIRHASTLMHSELVESAESIYERR